MTTEQAFAEVVTCDYQLSRLLQEYGMATRAAANDLGADNTWPSEVETDIVAQLRRLREVVLIAGAALKEERPDLDVDSFYEEYWSGYYDALLVLKGWQQEELLAERNPLDA